MSGSGAIALFIIIANFLVSYRGFTDPGFMERYKFEVDKILLNKDYKRIITSGFLHVSWMHLIFNLISLYIFSGVIEATLGPINYLIIYFGSLVGGSLLSLFINRNHGSYSAVGASGAISGIMFASIALFPGMGIGLFFIPISIPSWIYGAFFVAFSIYAIRSSRDNIGHDAHLGGALVGMLIACILQPQAFLDNYITILIIAIPTLIFIYIITTRPEILLVDNLFYKQNKNFYSVDHKYNDDRNSRQREIDQILDKISKRGMKSLTKAERDKLAEHSRNIH